MALAELIEQEKQKYFLGGYVVSRTLIVCGPDII